MTAEPPPGQNPYGSAPPPPPGSYPPPGGYGAPQGSYGGPQGAPLPPGVPAPVAQWWERWVARIIDTIIFSIVYFILSMIFNAAFGPKVSVNGLSVEASGSVFLPGFLAALIAYGAYAAYDYVLHSKDGQTVGKKVMKIRVLPRDGGALDSSALLKRSLLYPGVLALYGIPVVSWLAAIFVLVTAILIITDKPLQQGLHDKIAGTIVVKTQG
ncbi:RDD family protein [Microbispora corallina]|uniref:RDD family protein n=1 Tax=Microbispora corallina TaxID=83302 RepID=UPI0023B29594|nr:RDD family protein [Microbispora corallina]